MKKAHLTGRIGRGTLDDLIAGKADNPIAEIEIPKLLADIISRGGRVVVKEELTGREWTLMIQDGKYKLQDA